MSDAGTQVAPLHASQPQGRSPLAHLLHALNQPLTGLQCSLELALASPRRREEYVRTLREGLQLIERMRILVEGVRELTAQSCAASTDQFDFDSAAAGDGRRPGSCSGVQECALVAREYRSAPPVWRSALDRGAHLSLARVGDKSDAKRK